jgi:hypothetical protein
MSDPQPNEFQDIHDALGIKPFAPDALAPTSSLLSEMQSAPGKIAGGVGNALGLGDAMTALRGGFTPEEAQHFVLTSAAGLLPMGKAERAGQLAWSAVKPVIEDAWKAGSAPTGALVDYLSGKGVLNPFKHIAQNYPEYDNLLDKLENKYGSWSSIYDPSRSAQQASLSDEAIEKHLAKNPGASIADVAGVHVEGPSEPFPLHPSVPPASDPAHQLALSTFKRDMPFGVPAKAQELGFTTPALHGTAANFWEGPPDQLRLPETQLGVHFGNPKQAAHFTTRGSPSAWNAPRTYPAVLQMQNPLETKDLGSWNVHDMKSALSEINNGEHESWISGDKRTISPEAKGQFPQHELDELHNIKDVRDYIASKGYDSIKYINNVEDTGHPSYILFQDSPTKPGYVIGARSPFARFDPSQLHLPSLAAGLGAGVLAYPFRGEEQR